MTGEMWLTVGLIVLGIYVFRPRRRRAHQGGVVARPLTTYQHQPRKRPQLPLLPLLARLLAKTAADLRQLLSETKIAAVEGWQSGGKNGRRHMSTTTRGVVEPTIKTTPVLAFSGAELGNSGTRERELEAEHEPELSTIGWDNKSRRQALAKWQRGEKLEKSELAMLIGGRRVTTMAQLDIVLAGLVEAGEG